jgi:hypothetical protein
VGQRIREGATLAGVFASSCSLADLLLMPLCMRMSLAWYLALAAAGALLGVRHGPRTSSRRPRLKRGLTFGYLGLGLAASLWMIAVPPPPQGSGSFPPSWESQCGWRYCERALGPGLLVSPFPVGDPGCPQLRMCADEYPFRDDAPVRRRLAEKGCERP